jgi:hypothetical protein
MAHPTLVMRVRFRSSLTLHEIEDIADERAPEFEALSGLIQKYYLVDSASGEIAGLYLWDSPEALTEYRDSDLRASIADAYHAEGEPDIEVYKVIKVLRD